ncbi:MAG: hypothetical protein OIF32_04175 [Campylobacterales bacterium]|nr:hypothetical protein [Campylobacterales bacterium]
MKIDISIEIDLDEDIQLFFDELLDKHPKFFDSQKFLEKKVETLLKSYLKKEKEIKRNIKSFLKATQASELQKINDDAEAKKAQLKDSFNQLISGIEEPNRIDKKVEA